MSEIEQKRNQYGISVNELADSIGVSRNTIYRWETEGTKPSPAHQKKINEFFSSCEKKEKSKAEMPLIETIQEPTEAEAEIVEVVISPTVQQKSWRKVLRILLFSLCILGFCATTILCIAMSSSLYHYYAFVKEGVASVALSLPLEMINLMLVISIIGELVFCLGGFCIIRQWIKDREVQK